VSRVVHLELHTHDRAGASAFYRELLQWRTEQIDSRWGTYHALVLGDTLDGGIVECGKCQPGGSRTSRSTASRLERFGLPART